jgi:hypothetical protein
MMSSAALLLPFWAGAESQIETGSARHLTASAHVDFKIIIPKVLSLEVASGIHPGLGAQTVAISSNSHNVALAATVPGSEAARHDVLLSGAARKAIAQEAPCTLDATGSEAPQASRMICTVSMP